MASGRPPAWRACEADDGRERTRTDFEKLTERAGFTSTAITLLPPPNAFCLIEAAPS